ncbi:GyrI-like domain-containing protein [Bittarella massiliensis (ex Durand et al. 2017)]|uniref:GyrI-like domain-containing protein n=1 Tax=Bittarella massiliensis (ex Durand et al. 2017) TaxID=1720313 RepID=UPI001AA0E01B|nr:GyrI-like domain-containing protein [Bittarella massiliensis (ex Durand et al. 2017)]MBO1680073.1 transcriptional regulator [Bittarella massiliensis (ex Durand et al. 2017)]
MAALDYKKTERSLYLPGETPSLIEVPPLPFVAVEGRGDPNEAGGEFSRAVSVLYAISYTIRMSGKGGHPIDGFFAYVVPPLEGWWWSEEGVEAAPGDKSAFCWRAAIRLPDFATDQVFAWAREEAARKKKLDTSAASRLVVDEGLCVQCLHRGSYDSEPQTLAGMQAYLAKEGYRPDLDERRRHHEIYLGDPRKTPVEKRKTVLRLPVASL